MLRRLGLLAALPWASAAGAETVRLLTEPVELSGRPAHMEGPAVSTPLRFGRPGWITSVSARVVEAGKGGRPVDGIFCHSIFARKDERSRPTPLGIDDETEHLLLSDGQNEVRLPPGFGVPVSTGTDYVVASMLQDEDGARPGSYRFAVRYEFTPAGSGRPLRTLDSFVVRLGSRDAEGLCGGMPVFRVPPGRHWFEKRFSVPADARVHYMAAHLHSRGDEVALVDEGSGETLYRGRVAYGPRGELLELPVYSSAGGFLLRRGRRYVLKASYRNPEDRPIVGMAVMRVYFARR